MRQGNHRYERALPEELGKSRRRRLFVWITAGALLVIALGAVAVALLRTPEKQQPPPEMINLGVAAAKQYLTEYHADREKLADPAAVALGERLMKEPFEIEANITLSSDDLPAELGLPLTRLLLGADIKYDMRDLGAKLRVLGMEWLSAYLIDDEVVVRVPSGAYSMPLDVPESADVSQSMGLGERAMGFAPLVAGDEDFYGRIADLAAQAVPAEATVVEEVSGTQAGEKVIRTVLDEAAMQSVLANMSAHLEKDEELLAKAEEIFAKTAAYYDMDAKTLGEWLNSVADGSVLADDFKLCWRVYERQGRYVGLDVEVANAGQTTEWRMRTELSGSESREAFSLSVNGKLVQNAEYTVTYRSGGVAVDGKFMLDAASAVNIKADIELEPDGDEYRLIGAVEIEGPVLSDKPVKLNVDIDAKIRAGEGLMALKEDSGWNDVYGEQWEPLEDPLKDLILPRM